MWSEVVELFRNYAGTGMIMIWYLISLIYLWINEKRKPVRILFLYVPMILLLVYFNPLAVKLVHGLVGSDIYWRILWLLPVTGTIAYSCVRIYGQIAREGKRLRADLFALCMAGALAASGSFMYHSPRFSRAENLYHMPEAVVHICDAIQVPGREVMAAFPLELTPYVRQYSPTTCMPYGREMVMKSWGYDNPLSDVMEQEVIDMEQLVPLAREAGCHYVIFRAGQELTAEPETYGWTFFQETDGYVIYRDPATELIIPQNPGSS